ncbi:MAG TPA: formate/nitrite transporter family protein [Myxococcaceae bacterium]|nr:formate/nitrite transporter family protein [Myxococcaceae bacterium]
MEHETIATAAAAARAKAGLLRHGPLQYLVLSALAGAYVGLGIVLIFAIGAPLAAAGSGATRAVMGASFGIALTLVIFAGSELFTGNNLIMTVGLLSRTVKGDALGRVWLASFVGNLAGSLLLALATAASGVLSKAPAKDFVLGVVAAKMAAPAGELFFRGVLCNALVCLAVWMGLRTKDETARLVLIFWCLFAFIGAGFEHSVANMTLLGIGLFLPHDPALVSWAGFARNLTLVTAGNIVGGALLIGLPYWFVAQGQRRLLAVRTVEEPVAAQVAAAR